MISFGLPAENTPENKAQRRWGGETKKRVWTVEGNTLLVNEPSQFLGHFYHLVAELFFGVQAFWHGAFSVPSAGET